MITQRSLVTGLAATIVTGLLVATAPSGAGAAPETTTSPTTPPRPGPAAAIAPADRSTILGPGYAASDDQIVHAVGDASGLHLLRARESQGYAWETVTTLAEPGIETDRWIGNTCVTPDGQHAAVVYAPRTATNRADLMQRGGFSAVVDLDSGVVHKLGFGSTLAYYNPGCGFGGSAVFSRYAGLDEPRKTVRTRLDVVDTTTGRSRSTSTVAGQLASAVPTRNAVVAVKGRAIVRVSGAGSVRRLVTADSPAHALAVTGSDAVTYVDRRGSTATAHRLELGGSAPRARWVARGPLHRLGLESGAASSALVTGATTNRGSSASLRIVDTGQSVVTSSRGHAALVSRTTPAPYTGERGQGVSKAWTRALTSPAVEPGDAAPVDLDLEVLRSDRTVDLAVTPGHALRDTARTGLAPSPLLRSSSAPRRTTMRAAADTPSGATVDSAALCAVPRNDPKTQVYQPTPRQVEWAVNQAVTGNLTTTRAANWKSAGMSSSWSPQGLIPRRALDGGGRVPSQVLLGILSQESNLWQASGHNLSGIPGNPLVGNYYGNDVYDSDVTNDFTIDWSKSDCGYGIAQVTDGMRKGDARGAFQQRAIALDYATNIAAGLDILIQKWNQTRKAGVIHDDGNPAYLENWIFAIWAYNSGFHDKGAAGQPWGVGWVNNPANTLWKPSRLPFMRNPTDAAHPQDWPYQEKVMGFAAYSISTPDGPGFRTAWWVDENNRDLAKPPIGTFCKPDVNSCDLGQDYGPSNHCGHKSAAGAYDYECWWNKPVAYHACSQGYCGNELLRFNSTYPEQPDGTNRPPKCDRGGLPSGALVVDDVASSVAPVSTTARPCGSVGASDGSFALSVPEQSSGKSAARIDLHQSGVGFGGHVWWTHTRKEPRYGLDMTVKGTWSFSSTLNQWGRVMVHIPDYAAHTREAPYVINNGAGVTKTRYALQRTRRNGWVSLGVFKFAGKPSVSLSSKTPSGDGSDDIAWDAMAIQPLAAKPKNFVVALGDSYTSGEGASESQDGDNGADYYKETDFGGDLSVKAGRNGCHRSRQAWSRKAHLADSTSSIGSRADAWDPALDFQLHACSGATTNNINAELTASGSAGTTPNALGQKPGGSYGEVSQIDKGYLDENTTLVLMSIGGNDARFSDIVKKCITSLSDVCQDLALSGETEPAKVTVPRSINGPVKAALTQTLQQVAARAPNAKILLVGYPVLLSRGGQCVPGIGTAEAPWMNEVTGSVMLPMMRGVATSLAASGLKIAFADPRSDFDDRGVCGDPEHIRGIVNQKTSGTESDVPNLTGLDPTSNQSFHPNVGGTTDYAAAVDRALRGQGW